MTTSVLARDHGITSAAAVLRTVLARGPLARDAIAQLTGLSPAGVSRQCASLAGLGLLTTRPAAQSPDRRAGRPRTELDIAADRHVVFGVHIAHHFATLAALDLRGRVLASEQVPHPGGEPERILAGTAARLREFRQHHQKGRIPVGLGVASGGWVDPDAGVLVEHSSLGWYDVPAGPILAELSGLPTRVDGHARALASAEAMFGAARGCGSLVHLFVGNVVDAAIVSGGRLYRGPGSAAGTVAHLPLGAPGTRCACGRSGCFEADAAEWAVTARAGRVSIADVVEAAGSGDPVALDVLLGRARTIGRAAALLFDVVNPEVLVVAEPGIADLPACRDAVRAEVSARSRGRVDAASRVLPTSFPGQDLLGVAAGAVQLDALYTDPHAFLA
ncbi:ROK family transcriptional regulator [Amycolatopsis sp. NPDC004079]|uniref:ROK family transcriptional regulator n=1 Tax=Amycolatopsis sp. NPDC004079 TaxID=3154549 RepID=UPI0033BAA135